MVWFHYLGRLLLQRKPGRSSASVKSLRALLTLEQLEDRCVPSISPTYVINTPNLHPNGGGGPSGGYGPSQLQQAYGFNAISFTANGTTVPGDGRGETIAIVDAYDAPHIASNLATFDQQFGIQAPPSFTKVGINAAGQSSTTQFPAQNTDWDPEIDLDVEWAHAMAPGANILLVESNSANLGDLENAINYARNAPGVVAVSMSWGGGEDPSLEPSADSLFTTPTGHAGVTFVASTGDSGAGTEWPSVSPNVVAAGGTSLTLNASNNYQSESAWSGGGGGVSSYEPVPSYQNKLVIYSGDGVSANGFRSVPDLSYDADPNTGVAIYGTDNSQYYGWSVVGGTSASSPQVAALIAIADQGRAANGLSSLDGGTQTLPDLYEAPSSDFHDVTTGSDGYAAGPGYDLATGLGSPVANKLVATLSTPPVQQQLTSVTITPVSATVADGGQEQFLATALDQFGNPMAVQPTFTWSITSGSGSISSSGLYLAPASGTGTATVKVTASGTISATASVQYLPGPSITSLTANPSPVTGTTTSLSALLADPNGGTLSYTWSIVSSPSGATAPTLSTSSGSTSGGTVSTTATFFQSGSYQFQISVTDASNISASSTVTVSVVATLSGVQITPGTAGVEDGTQQQFTATAEDQFGNPLATQPTFTWSLPGGQGTIDQTGLYTAPSAGSGTATVQATTGSFSSTATVTYAPGLAIQSLTASPVGSDGTATLSAQLYDVSGAVMNFTWSVVSEPDPNFPPSLSSTGGSAYNGLLTNSVTFSAPGTYVFELDVTDPSGASASQQVSVTVTAQPLTISGLTASPVGNDGTATLSAQLSDPNPTIMSFNWSVVSGPDPNSLPSLSSTGGSTYNGPISTTATFYGPGTYVFELDVSDSWGASASSTVTVVVGAATPTITWSPTSPVTGTTATLGAQLSDPNATAMNYTWSVVSGPAGVTFSPSSGSTTSATANVSSTATFTRAGTYQVQLSVTDGVGASTTSEETVTVNQTLTRVTLTPATATVADGGTKQFTAAAYDQFNRKLSPQPTFTWSVSGTGSVSSSGLYTAPATGAGTTTITATASQNGQTFQGTAQVSYESGPVITGLLANPSPVTGTTTSLSALLSDPNGGTLSYTWSIVSSPSGATAPTLSTSSGSTSGGTVSTTATFFQTGSYQFQISVTDASNISASSTVTVSVVATLAGVQITPGTAGVEDGAQQQFTATAVDQFGNPLATQPTFTWSVPGGQGSIDNTGLYTAPSTGTGTDTVQVTVGSVSSTAPVTYSPGLAILSLTAGPVGSDATATITANLFDANNEVINYSWSVVSEPDPNFPPNLSSTGGSAYNGDTYTVVTFYAPGTYVFELDVSDPSGATASEQVTMTVNPQPPTITWSPTGPVTTASTTLSAQIADSDATAMNFTWSVVSTPTNAPTPSLSYLNSSSLNGPITNSVTFYAPGTYQFGLSVTDGWGATASSTVTVSVVSTFTKVALTPASATVTDGGKEQFKATAVDQFSKPLSTQPTFTWSLSGMGSHSGGLYVAPTTGTGTATVKATATVGSVSKSTTASVSYKPSSPNVVTSPPAIATFAGPTSNVTGTTTLLTLAASDPAHGTLSYAWTVTGPDGAPAPTIVHVAGNIWKVTFHQAGNYTFQVQVTSSKTGAATTSADVSVTVVQTFTRVKVTPATASVSHGSTTPLQLLAEALDQFLIALTTQPSFSWSVSGTARGTLSPGTSSSIELYLASSRIGTDTITVQASSNGVTKRGAATVKVI